MHTLRGVTTLTGTILLLAAYGAFAQTPSPSPAPNLGDTAWQLVEFQGSDDKTLAPDDEAKSVTAHPPLFDKGETQPTIDGFISQPSTPQAAPSMLQTGKAVVAAAVSQAIETISLSATSLFYVVLLGVALSMDALVAGVAYGLKSIDLPPASLGVTGLVCFACTAIAMFGAQFLSKIVNTRIVAGAGALVLISMGLFALLQEYLSAVAVEDDLDVGMAAQQITFSVGRLVINIMLRPEAADLDHSQVIGAVEAIFLGLALGVDNAVATFAAALTGLLPVYTPVVMALVQMSFISIGFGSVARLISDDLKRRVPYWSGAILILLGLLRLL